MGAVYVPSQLVDISGLKSALNARYVGGSVLQKPIVASLGHCYFNRQNVTLSNGADTSGTYRKKHIVTTNACDIQCVFGNQTGDVAAPDTVVYTAAIEYPSGTVYPLTFQGATSATIVPGGIAISDPVGIDIAAGQDFWTRTCPQVAAGKKWPTGPAITTAVSGEGYTANVDYTRVTTGVTSVTAYCSCPMAILGTTNPRSVPLIALLGDSIMTGEGETGGVIYDRGWAERALNYQFGYMRIARGAESAQTFAAVGNRPMRMRLVNGCTHAICEYGVNDFYAGRTLVQMQTDLTSIWNTLILRGMKVYQSTITPRTTSSDNWATTANQTVTANESVRVALNNWIRSNPSPLTNYFETADVCETTRDSGKWKNDGATAFLNTIDGIHPSTAMHILMAAAVNTGMFTV